MSTKRAASLQGVVVKGDYAKSLAALRDRLAAEIDEARETGAPVAALSRQLVEVLDKLAALPGVKKESAVDELAKRRAARRAGPEVQKRAGARVVRGAGGGRTRG